jgi:mono/diheme cytochrome c family protein
MTSRWLQIAILLAVASSAEARTNTPAARPRGLEGGPEAARQRSNPLEGNAEAGQAGRKLYERYCARCHGPDARGRGDTPSLISSGLQRAPAGTVFWFLTNGDLRHGMPAWSRLPDARRWQLTAYINSIQRPTPASPARSPVEPRR